ncbi:hypothetical protein [Campylobacter lanienae]|uniref:YtxH domain-containing protein n=1 Tax=Campylobacter lanienae TaxID=75658 RepID=A0ABY3G7I4_9BACT|nr:hypothetical protein [Campylobacter lanienae]TWO28235.1 hypothetical protein XK09_06075 [Campylobacter lanienae]
MALPFIAGIAIGAGVAFAFSKRDEIAKSFKSLNLDQKIQDGINLGKQAITKNSKTDKAPRKKSGRKPKAKSTAKDSQNSAQTTDQTAANPVEAKGE